MTSLGQLLGTEAPIMTPDGVDLFSFCLFFSLWTWQSAPLQDAMQSMNGVLDAEPDPQAAFNLVLCTFALGDKEMMKQAFSKLVEVIQTPLHKSAICVHRVRCIPCCAI